MVGYASKRAISRDRSYMEVVDEVIMLAEEYMDDCQYKKVNQLASEDIDYIATEVQIGLSEVEGILREHMGFDRD